MSSRKSPFPASSNRNDDLLARTCAALRVVAGDSAVATQLRYHHGVLYGAGEPFALGRFRCIHAIAAGKAAVAMAQGLQQVLGDLLQGGLIVSLAQSAWTDSVLAFLPASHPFPDQTSQHAAQSVCAYVREQVAADDLVIVLLSGGASALLAMPLPGLTIADKMATTRLLLASGADIHEVNAVRKHISAIKGGRLAKITKSAHVLVLAISDVIGAAWDVIGSGLFSPDPTTYAQAWDVVQRYQLTVQLPEAVIATLQAGMAGRLAETPKPGDPVFKNYSYQIIADNRRLLDCLQSDARRAGYMCLILDDADHGEAREVARSYAQRILAIARSRQPFSPPLLLLAGGELTVTVRGSGKGGRNQEFVLAMLLQLVDLKQPFWLASIASDGIDGPTNAAGAWIDQKSIAKVRQLGLDPHQFLKRNDSYNFFKQLGQLIVLGPSQTNVMDVRVFAIY